jgi:two-component system chemotaxis response regulator CheY
MTSKSEPDHILVVDDYSAHRNALSFSLSKAGFKVSAAADAARALKLADNEHFDLVITDYYMPDYSGSDFIKKLRENEKYANTPTILLTARADELNLDRLRDDLSVLVVAKPCSTKHLVEMVTKCLALAHEA